ncbi:MAG: hypothetical protein V7731_17520 [Amphritea sp.]
MNDTSPLPGSTEWNPDIACGSTQADSSCASGTATYGSAKYHKAIGYTTEECADRSRIAAHLQSYA